MPLILAFDATAGRCAVAVFDGDTLLAERSEMMDRGHAERLFPMIETCLEAANAAPGALDIIAVCTGPGNFTGARIGVAAARGLALSTGATAIGVDRFEALAHGQPGPVSIVLEARGGAIHLAAFADGSLTGDARTLQAEDATESVEGSTLIGDAAHRYAGIAGQILSESADAPLTAIAAIAKARAATGAPRPAPRYLRPVNAALPSAAPPRIIG